MATDAEIAVLRDRLAKAQALAARGATPGERMAAQAAVERIRLRLDAMLRETSAKPPPPPPPPPPPSCEFRYSIRDPYGRRVFKAMCEVRGYRMLRRKHQRHTTIRVKVPSAAHGNRLFDEYLEIHSFLQRDLVEVAERVIRERVRAGR